MTAAASLLFLCLVANTVSLQFFLLAKTKKCFREDIRLGAGALLTYNVAQGDGEMHIVLSITDMTGKVIHSRDSIDHGVFSFKAPDRIPGLAEKDNWALHDDEKDENDDAYYRTVGGAGDDRVWYSFCFEHSAGMRMPSLSLRGTQWRRRIIFDIKFGSNTREMDYYEKLAKEKHLSSTEALFRVVEDRVTSIVHLIDEMRQRELRLSHLSSETNGAVFWYSMLACFSIFVGAMFSSYATVRHLSREKVM